MSSRGWVMRAVLGAIGWAWLGLGLAQAGVVPPTDPATLKLSADASVTVSLYQLDDNLLSALTLTLNAPSRCTKSGIPGLYRDVTDCWLPEWNPVNGGKSVFVVINGSTETPTLVLPPAAPPTFPLALGAANPFVAALTTSAYPGQCTNFGTDTGPDFTLSLANPQPILPVLGLVYELKPTDCGGMAVIQVGSRKFLLPKDGTATVVANGLPEVWENLYGGSLNPVTEDIDTGPVATSPVGDGLSTADEYRGFIVSERQIRTDPKQKDLFVRVVNPADSVGGVFVTSTSCGTSCYGGGTTTYPAPTAPSATLTVPATAGTPGAIATFTTSSGVFSNAHVRGEIIRNGGGRARIVAVAAPTSATSVTAEITQAFPTTPTSLPSGAWQVSESLFAVVYTLVAPERLHILGYTPGATNPTTTNEWVDNFVSLVPAQTLTISDAVTDRIVNANRLYGLAQKGVRAMEALNTNSSSVLGWSFGVASPNEAGNVVVFTQRIINSINSKIGTATTLKYAPTSAVTPVVVNRDFVLSKAFQFYTGHEIHHSLDLTPGVQGTNQTTYGHHWAPSTGDCLDQSITTTSKSGTVTFYIPSQCPNDQALFLIQ